MIRISPSAYAVLPSDLLGGGRSGEGIYFLLYLSYYTVFLAVKGSPSGGPFVVGAGEGKMNQYWSLSGPVLVANSDQYYFAS